MIPEHYHIYGLNVVSSIAIPEAATIRNPKRDVDVQIVLGPVQQLSDRLRPASFLETQDNATIIAIPDIARYRIDGQSVITVDPFKGASHRIVRTFLLGIVFSALLYRRGCLPLHVSAVATPQGVVAFTGLSGSGKSTTAAVLNRRMNWPILCDDVAVVSVVDGRARLQCGLNRLKLWREKIEMLALKDFEMTPDPMRQDKFHLIAPQLFDHSCQVLSRLIVLSKNGERTRIEGAQKFLRVRENIYRPEVAYVVGDHTKITETCADVANSISIIRLDGSGVLGGKSKAIDTFLKALN